MTDCRQSDFTHAVGAQSRGQEEEEEEGREGQIFGAQKWFDVACMLLELNLCVWHLLFIRHRRE
jgi:hypothetical protein